MGGQDEEDLCRSQRVAVRVVRAMHRQIERPGEVGETGRGIRLHPSRVAPLVPAAAADRVAGAPRRGPPYRRKDCAGSVHAGRALPRRNPSSSGGDLRDQHPPGDRLEQLVQHLRERRRAGEVALPRSPSMRIVSPSGIRRGSHQPGSARHSGAPARRRAVTVAKEMISLTAGSRPVISRSITL